MSEDVVRIDYDRKKILGSGVYGIVFKGKFGGKEVAIKRTPLFFVMDLITKDEFLLRIRHPNVVIILHISRDEDFRFTIMELCAASLDHLFLRGYNRPAMPSNEQVLLQLASGLGYLHSLNILHGDIKPENILISSTKPVKMKWTGFGFRQSNDSYSLSVSEPQLGSRKWWPPEMYLDETKASEAGEIFSAGCVFLYFLSVDGVHPFGSLELAGEIELKKNVTDGNPVNLKEKNQAERIPLWNIIHILEIQQRPYLNNTTMITKTLPSLQYEEKKYLNGKYSCGLYRSKFDRLAVKRIPKNYCLVKSCKGFQQFNQFNISNFVRTLHFEEIGGYFFYVMEFCLASLDHFFLPEKDPKRYGGPMPSHEQFFFQLVTGLEYIHRKNLVHGSIKPSNILIYSKKDPQIKLSDFGLTLPQWNEKMSLKPALTGFESNRYWIAPELHQSFEKAKRKHSFEKIFKPTVGSDFYALGKVFFYYYCQTYEILNALQQNTFEGSHEYMFKKLPMLGYCKIRNENYPNELFTEMVEINLYNRLKLTDVVNRVLSYQLTSKGELNRPKHNASGNIQFSRDHILGKGGQAVVYLGLWKDSIAAIKRINTRIHGTPEVVRELGFLQSLNHPNIVKFFGYEKDNDFMYIAIEKCLISLNAYCQHRRLYFGVIPMRSNKEVLLQLAQGLQYIHSQHLIHGDVKPGNILISYDDPNKTTNLKFADFGLSKSVPKDEISSQKAENWSFLQGTEGWMAPELTTNCKTSWNEKTGQKCDIFALGCVFFFFLVPAFHPFGNTKSERMENIKKGNPMNLTRLGAFKDIIQGMIELQAENRFEIVDVIAKLGEDESCDKEMCALTEASSRLSVEDDQPNPKRQKN